MAHVEYKLEEVTPQKKQLSTWFIAVLAVVVLIAGGTLAYLTTTTNTASNMFTAGNIKAELIEEAWLPSDPADGTSGSEIAAMFLPGTVAPKDPLIMNTSDFDTGEWTGMVVKFQKPTAIDGNGEPDSWTNMTDAEVTALLTGVRVQSGSAAITTGGFVPQADWGSRIDVAGSVDTLIPGQQVFAYDALIEQNTRTAALFDQVGIIPTAGNGAWDGTLGNVSADNFMTWLYADLASGGLGGHFQIEVQGAAVQEEVPEAERNGALLTLFGYTLPAGP